MNRIARSKDILVRRLLGQSKYVWDSSVYQTAEKALRKLSQDDLIALDLMIACRVQEAMDKEGWVGNES